MHFQNWPRRVKNIVFLTLDRSIKQNSKKGVLLKKKINQMAFVSASTILEVNKGSCIPG